MLPAESVEHADAVVRTLAESAPEGVAECDADAHRVEVWEREKVGVVEVEAVTEGEAVGDCVSEEEGVPLYVRIGVAEALGDSEPV